MALKEQEARSLAPVTYTAAPPFSHPVQFLRSAWNDLRRSRTLALEMARRDVRSQFRQSLFGALLVLLPPLALTVVGVAFRHAEILPADPLAIPFDLYVLIGAVLWTTFAEALNAPIHGIQSEQRLMARTAVPPEAIVLGKLGVVLFNFAIKLSLLIAGLIYFGRAPTPMLALAPVGLIGLLALGTAFGMLLAPLNILYNDIARVLGTVTTFWFFLTPVYFQVPEEGLVALIMSNNPVTPVLNGTRDLIATGVLGEPGAWLLGSLLPFALLLLAWVWVRVSVPITIEQSNG